MNLDKVILCAFADEADGALDGQIEAMKANGISQLEIRFADGKNIVNITPDEAKEIKAKLDANGISVWSLGSPIGKIKITDDFDAELERYRKMLEVGQILGAKVVRIFSFFGTEGDPKYLPEITEKMKKYVEIANEYGIIPCHENEKGIYGDNAARCLEILQAVPGLKSVFDPANFIQCDQDTLEAWNMLEEYVYYGHIKDANEDKKIVPPGQGIGHIAEYLPKFFAKGCNVLTLEPHLAEFVGLASLEEEGDKSDVGSVITFKNNREAFDFAVDSLKGIIETI